MTCKTHYEGSTNEVLEISDDLYLQKNHCKLEASVWETKEKTQQQNADSNSVKSFPKEIPSYFFSRIHQNPSRDQQLDLLSVMVKALSEPGYYKVAIEKFISSKFEILKVLMCFRSTASSAIDRSRPRASHQRRNLPSPDVLNPLHMGVLPHHTHFFMFHQQPYVSHSTSYMRAKTLVRKTVSLMYSLNLFLESKHSGT